LFQNVIIDSVVLEIRVDGSDVFGSEVFQYLSQYSIFFEQLKVKGLVIKLVIILVLLEWMVIN